MGASISSFSFGPTATSSKGATASATTPGKPAQTPSRRSRRVTQSDPTKVNFKSNPVNPTPQIKKSPLTPKSRAEASDKMKPIVRKSSRFSKFRVPKHQDAPKYSAKLSYEVDEMVYIWDKKLLYEAKVEKREGNKYKVHFVGYKKAHDKWYTTDDMMGKE
jgi:hypothetical protein